MHLPTDTQMWPSRPLQQYAWQAERQTFRTVLVAHRLFRTPCTACCTCKRPRYGIDDRRLLQRALLQHAGLRQLRVQHARMHGSQLSPQHQHTFRLGVTGGSADAPERSPFMSALCWGCRRLARRGRPAAPSSRLKLSVSESECQGA